MYGQPFRRSAVPGSTPASMPRRRVQVSESPGGTMQPATEATDEEARKVLMLEAEVVRLREKLAQAQAKREEFRQEMDDLRRDRDHWRNLAKLAGAEKETTRTWFCGRALPGK